LCERIGADVMEIVRLANSHPRVNIHFPGPGVGGPCIPKDPDLLIHAAKKEGLNLPVVAAAQSANELMPEHVLDMVQGALRYAGERDGRPKVAILGTAYKAGVPSAQSSPAEKVIKGLADWDADVVVYDPYCTETFGADRAETLEEAARGADCLVILTEHEEFRRTDLSLLKSLMNRDAIIVDTRRIFDPGAVARLGIEYAGIGLGSRMRAQGARRIAPSPRTDRDA